MVTYSKNKAGYTAQDAPSTVCVIFTFENNWGRTDRTTDGRTDRHPSYRDATAHLKKTKYASSFFGEDERKANLVEVTAYWVRAASILNSSSKCLMIWHLTNE